MLEDFYEATSRFKSLTETLQMHKRDVYSRLERKTREKVFKPVRDRMPARRERMQRHKRHSRTLAAPKIGQFNLPGTRSLAAPALRLSTRLRSR